MSLPSISGITLSDDSVTTRSTWIESGLNVPANTNTLSFDYQFDKDVNSQMSVFLNGGFIFRAGEIVHGLSKDNSGEIFVGDKLNDNNVLGIRYDTFSNDNSTTLSVFISDIKYGNVSERKNGATDWWLY